MDRLRIKWEPGEEKHTVCTSYFVGTTSIVMACINTKTLQLTIHGPNNILLHDPVTCPSLIKAKQTAKRIMRQTFGVVFAREVKVKGRSNYGIARAFKQKDGPAIVSRKRTVAKRKPRAVESSS